MSRTRIPAVYMRGGASKGVFFLGRDLPQTTAERDALLLRIVGSPDRYRNHADGMGGATQATSKVVIVSPSWRDECDVDYLFGAVSIDTPVIDWPFFISMTSSTGTSTWPNLSCIDARVILSISARCTDFSNPE